MLRHIKYESSENFQLQRYLDARYTLLFYQQILVRIEKGIFLTDNEFDLLDKWLQKHLTPAQFLIINIKKKKLRQCIAVVNIK